MKLALKLENVTNLRRILGFVLSIRKQCIFKFETDQLIIISVDNDSPLVWNTIDKSIFARFDVVAKDACIGLELNAEPLFQILKNFEKAPVTSELVIKLQRGEEFNGKNKNGDSNSNITGGNKRRSVILAVSYNEDVSCTSEISHSFNIPVNLLRGKFIEKIQMPKIHNVELIVDLNATLIPFFMRIERYKATEMIHVVMNRLGELKIELQDEGKRMSVKWKLLLDTYQPEDIDTQSKNRDNINGDEDLNMIREITVKVKSRWWNIASKLIELCETTQMYIYGDGCVFNCHVGDEQNCSILYYLPGKLLE